MSIQILDQIFLGPYENDESLPNKPGVYVIISTSDFQSFIVLDVGQSLDIKDRVNNHERKLEWQKFCNTIRYCCLPIYDEDVRCELEKNIRMSYRPLCGIK